MDLQHARRSARARSSRPATPRPATPCNDQPVEVGMKFRSDEDGYITALRFYKQPNNTRHARRAPVVRHRPAAGGGHVHRTRRRRAGRRWTCPTRCRSRRTPPTSRPTTRPPGASRSAPATSTRASTAPPLHAPAPRRDGGNGVYQLRRQRLPRPDLQRDQLLGRRGLRPHHPAGHARADGHGAGARAGAIRRRGARPRSRRPSTSRWPRATRHRHERSRCATRTATWSRPT